MSPVAMTSSSTINGTILDGPTKPVNGSAKATWRPALDPNPPKRNSFAFDTMEDALAAFKAGEFLMVMDDEGRENEGDMIIAASECTTEKMAWMIKHTR